MPPFGRYPPVGGFGTPPSTFPSMAGFPSRDIPSLGSLPAVHDPWRFINFHFEKIKF